MKWHLVVPSMKVSGGIREALRLGDQLATHGASVAVLSLWTADNPVPTELPVHSLSTWRAITSRAVPQWPLLAVKFLGWMKSPAGSVSERFLFTHYSTLPLSLFVPRARRYFFVQDLEWKFVNHRLVSALLRRMILFFYRRGSLVSANAYLTACLEKLGLAPMLEAPIWADPSYLTEQECPRDVDFVMMLRKGAHKRLQDYHTFIALARRHGDRLKLAAISPDDDLVATVRDSVDVCLLRPTLEQMRDLYQRTKCFVHLSEHEGFGLPPLEAMGAGCIPLCRDSGGVRAFMANNELSALLMSCTASVEDVYRRGCDLLADESQLRHYSAAARRAFDRGSLAVANTGARIQPLLS